MAPSLDDRGVSETISFVLVFALIIGTVGSVYALGYGGLQEVRDAERVNNAERAFDVLAANMEDIVRRGAPSRGTEIQLAEASLGPGEPTYINVSGTDGTTSFTTGNTTIEPVVYEAENTQIRYVAGAVIRVQTNGVSMLREPLMVLSADNVVIPLVQLNVEEQTVGGSQTVLVRAESQLRRVLVSENDGSYTVTVNVTSPANDAWYRYLEDQGMSCSIVDPTPGPERVTCEFSNVERVHVVWHLIEVQIE